MLKSIYFNFRLPHLYEVCLLGEMSENGSSLAKARFILAHLAQPCMHLAAANHNKSGRLCRHRTKKQGFQPYRSPEPQGRYARTSEPPRGAGLKALGGSPTQRRARPKGSAAGRWAEGGDPLCGGGCYYAAPEPEALCAIEGECRH